MASLKMKRGERKREAERGREGEMKGESNSAWVKMCERVRESEKSASRVNW